MKKSIVILASVATAALTSVTAQAHHSMSMFDQTRRVTIQGVVTKVEWTNPHVWVFLDVPQQNGTHVQWGIEFTSVNHLTRVSGMTRNSIKPGDAVEFTVNPYSDGTPGGRFYTVKMPGGHYFCDVGAAQQVCEEKNK